MRIYIAGALSTLPPNTKDERTPSKVVVDYIANLSHMCKVASIVRKKGHTPYVPGMDLMLGLVNGNWDEDEYRGVGMSFLEVCDAILITSMSWGVQKELDRANELSLRVYDHIDDIPTLQ